MKLWKMIMLAALPFALLTPESMGMEEKTGKGENDTALSYLDLSNVEESEKSNLKSVASAAATAEVTLTAADLKPVFVGAGLLPAGAEKVLESKQNFLKFLSNITLGSYGLLFTMSKYGLPAIPRKVVNQMGGQDWVNKLVANPLIDKGKDNINSPFNFKVNEAFTVAIGTFYSMYSKAVANQPLSLSSMSIQVPNISGVSINSQNVIQLANEERVTKEEIKQVLIGGGLKENAVEHIMKNKNTFLKYYSNAILGTYGLLFTMSKYGLPAIPREVVNKMGGQDWVNKLVANPLIDKGKDNINSPFNFKVNEAFTVAIGTFYSIYSRVTANTEK